MPDATSDSRADAYRSKQWVTLVSFGAAALLTLAKIVVGLMTNSLGILSDAAHSGLDLLSSGFTLWAVRLAAAPADREHPYGHGKFENIAALFQTVLLIVVCAWIVYEAVSRLALAAPIDIEPNAWAFGVMLLSLVVEFWRSRVLHHAAQKYRSPALAADALHRTTDVLSSVMVLLGLSLVLVAGPFGMPWLVHGDALAALLVAAIVVRLSLRLGRQAVNELIDAAPLELRDRIARAAGATDGVQSVRQVRVRRSGAEVFADVTLAVGRHAGLETAHEVADRAEAAIRAVAPDADVVVHVEPVDDGSEDLTTTAKVLARRHGLGAHAVRIYEGQLGRSIELHVEVDASLDLEAAHRKVSQFEHELRRNVPHLERVVTHIEPGGDAAATCRAEPVGQLDVQRLLTRFLTEHPVALRPHDVRVNRSGDQFDVSFHCALDPQTAITDAHRLTEQIEDYLRRQIPNLGRVLIHVEPM